MECKQYLAELLDTNLVYRVPKSDMLGITQDGVSCLSLFFTKIPSSIRDEIVEYARENRNALQKTPIIFLRLFQKRGRNVYRHYAHQQRHHHPYGTQTRRRQPPTRKVSLQKLGGQGFDDVLSHLRQLDRVRACQSAPNFVRGVLFFLCKSDGKALLLQCPPSSRVWTSAFAMQSASFALATTHSQDVLLYASRPHRRSPLKGNPRRPLRVGTH